MFMLTAGRVREELLTQQTGQIVHAVDVVVHVELLHDEHNVT